jgi:hypothetical protein
VNLCFIRPGQFKFLIEDADSETWLCLCFFLCHTLLFDILAIGLFSLTGSSESRSPSIGVRIASSSDFELPCSCPITDSFTARPLPCPKEISYCRESPSRNEPQNRPLEPCRRLNASFASVVWQATLAYPVTKKCELQACVPDSGSRARNRLSERALLGAGLFRVESSF